MKLEARHVRFKSPLPWFTRRRLMFVGKRNTLQLQETALIVEGYLMRLFFPLIGFLFNQAFSEWTTVTIPYSRILRFQHSRLWAARLLLTAILLLPLAVVLGVELLDTHSPDWLMSILQVGLAEVVVLALALYLNVSLLGARNYLWFRRADGRHALLVFRIRSRKRQQAFEEQLRGYRGTRRKEAGLPQERQETEPARGRGLYATWVVLALYLVAHWLVVPLYVRAQMNRPRQMPIPQPVVRPSVGKGKTVPAGKGKLARPQAALQQPPANVQGGDWLWLRAIHTVVSATLQALLNAGGGVSVGLLSVIGLLPALLVSLMLASRSASLRWPAAASLLLAILPSVHLMGLAGNLVSLIFHALLAVALILVTSPDRKEEQL